MKSDRTVEQSFVLKTGVSLMAERMAMLARNALQTTVDIRVPNWGLLEMWAAGRIATA